MTDRNAACVSDDRTQTIGSAYLGICTTLERAFGHNAADVQQDEMVMAEAFKQAIEAAKRVLGPYTHLRLDSDV